MLTFIIVYFKKDDARKHIEKVRTNLNEVELANFYELDSDVTHVESVELA